MLKMKLCMKNYKEYLKHIRDEIEFIMRESKGLNYNEFLSSETLTRAFIRSIEIIGEASKNIPDEVKEKYPNIEWKRIAGTRDVLIHRYFSVDNEILWDIISHKLPELYDVVISILNE